ncbi:MAG: hypothetical protein AAF850_07070 [Pseudomonadota bacterium]
MAVSELADSSADRDDLGPVGEENVRFIRNFHDIFLSLGLAILISGVALTSFLIGGEAILAMFNGSLGTATQGSLRLVAGIAAANALVAWLLAEVFARSRRLFLPAIVTYIAFTTFFSIAVTVLYASTIDIQNFSSFFGNEGPGSTSLFEEFLVFGTIMYGAAAFASLLYYARTKLALSFAIGAASFFSAIVSMVSKSAPGLLITNSVLIQILSGVFLFLLGIYFDARDPMRRTRFADNGFWLHFFAAPTIFYAVLMYVTSGAAVLTGGFSSNIQGPPVAVATLMLVFVFALISVLINRRAFLVSGLLAAIIAVGVLFNSAGLGAAWTAAGTLLTLGIAMVVLGGAWSSIRRVVVSPFPKTGFWARIIPPEPDEERAETA